MKNPKNTLSAYRIKDAKEKLESAEILFQNKKFKDAVSRTYYAMFSAARALLAMKGLDSSKHSGVISLFNLHFVRPGIVAKLCGKILASAKDIREESDYGDFVRVSKGESAFQLEQAEKFITEVESALKVLWKENEK